MLKQRDIIRIVNESNLPESADANKDQTLAKAPKGLRMSMIRESEKTSDEARICAAIEIQRCVRGYRVRCRVYERIEPKTSCTAVYSGSRPNVTRLQEVEDNQDDVENIDNIDTDMLQPVAETPTDLSCQDIPSQKHVQHQQAMYVDMAPQRLEASPATTPKASMVVVKKREGPLSESEASICIQRAWRKHIDIQVYRYYRDLINFKTRGDPSLMLRCINPSEAKLLDPAAGIHVRFRLAGERFPPNIYYKIFTHRPIVDMCANSPKDYTRPDTKKTKAKDTHNKNSAFLKPSTSKEGWYQRIENNGWRLVSDRLIHHIMSDPVTWQTSQKKYEFHHDKLVRKQDVEKRRKRKKIDWMRKMYHDGMLKAKADDYETVKLIEGAAAGMVATVEAAGPQALEEWEVDELLDWTTSLNFDDYLTTWKDIATSSDSEQKIADKMRIVTNHMDPYEFTLSTGPSRFQSTRQSHNTPVSSTSGTKIHVHVNS